MILKVGGDDNFNVVIVLMSGKVEWEKSIF